YPSRRALRVVAAGAAGHVKLAGKNPRARAGGVMSKSAKSGQAPAAASVDDPAKTNTIIVGISTKYEVLDLHFANRHGLVAGATGTGKTVSLQVLAEGLSEAGVPVFAADIKGDLSGIAATGETKDALVARAKDMGLTYQPDRYPVIFWDV